MAHVHAEAMRLYAEDAKKTTTPWVGWLWEKPGVICSLGTHPRWEVDRLFIRGKTKDEIQMPSINLPKPITTPPTLGKTVYVIRSSWTGICGMYWGDGSTDMKALEEGRVHLTYENAMKWVAIKEETKLLARKVYERDNKPHPHAEAMMQYAEDAEKFDKPWLQWEMQGDKGGAWMEMTNHPSWLHDFEYRRKATFVRIYDQYLPKPETKAPPYCDRMFSPAPESDKKVYEWYWANTPEQQRALEKGTRFLEKEHAAAWSDFHLTMFKRAKERQ